MAHRCRFFCDGIFRHRALEPYDYYWRLDTDSFVLNDIECARPHARTHARARTHAFTHAHMHARTHARTHVACVRTRACAHIPMQARARTRGEQFGFGAVMTFLTGRMRMTSRTATCSSQRRRARHVFPTLLVSHLLSARAHARSY